MRPPLAGRYSASVALSLLALCPYLVLSTASQPLQPLLVEALHTSRDTLVLVEGLSNAGYALGAVIAAYLAQKLLSRHLFFAYEGLFVLGSVLAASAPSVAVFGAGRMLQGIATGLLLVTALPPLVTRWGVGKLPVTVALVDVGLFGATTIGPLLGGPLAQTGHWRPLFVAAAVLGALGLLAGALGYQVFDPFDPQRRLDPPVVPLAVAATFLPFLATSLVARVGFTSPVFLGLFVVGILSLVVLVVQQFRADDPLMPVKALSTQLPVTGTLVAMVAGAVVVAVLQLLELYLADVAKQQPRAAGLMLWPLPVGLLVATVAFGLLLRTRWLPVLIDVGLVALAGGAGLLLALHPSGPGTVVGWSCCLLGFGAGATVSPGLFLAAMGVESTLIGRAFALVELLRSEAAFAVAPVLAALAQGNHSLPAGIRAGVLAMLVVAVLGLVAALVVPWLSGARLRVPDLEAWLERGEPALPTPQTLTHVRSGAPDDVAEPLLPGR